MVGNLHKQSKARVWGKEKVLNPPDNSTFNLRMHHLVICVGLYLHTSYFWTTEHNKVNSINSDFKSKHLIHTLTNLEYNHLEI